MKNSSNVQISLFDIRGVKIIDIFNGSLNSGTHSIKSNVEVLSAGLYILEIITSDGIRNNYKLIKR